MRAIHSKAKDLPHVLDPTVLEHQKKRKMYAEMLEYRNKLEKSGKTEEEIEKVVERLKTSLLVKSQ